MNDQKYMGFAIQIANKMIGQTSPNPAVGAVIVKNGTIVGFGSHLKAGDAHAEAVAFNMAGDLANGATMYVTLEPCSHYGKTNPCADLIIKKKISRVVVATVDPNEKVSGKGINRLKEAGLQVEIGLLREEAMELNKEFFHYIKTKKPYVTMKTATSLDGKIATYKGESQWITGVKARLDVHQNRHQHDAILVGVQTVITDNPSLTTRLPNGGKNPIRIILDTTLRTPIHANVVTNEEGVTWIFTGKNVKQSKLDQFSNHFNVEVIQLESESISINDVLQVLGKRKVMSLFVEGGSVVNGSFLESGKINQVITYIAPKLIGGTVAPTSIGGTGIGNIQDVPKLKIKTVEQIGEDIKVVSEFEKEENDVYWDC